ncbi:hypothetical protein RQP46_005657 [Phenoliferia psychrophenolica]
MSPRSFTLSLALCSVLLVLDAASATPHDRFVLAKRVDAPVAAAAAPDVATPAAPASFAGTKNSTAEHIFYQWAYNDPSGGWNWFCNFWGGGRGGGGGSWGIPGPWGNAYGNGRPAPWTGGVWGPPRAGASSALPSGAIYPLVGGIVPGPGGSGRNNTNSGRVPLYIPAATRTAVPFGLPTILAPKLGGAVSELGGAGGFVGSQQVVSAVAPTLALPTASDSAELPSATAELPTATVELSSDLSRATGQAPVVQLNKIIQSVFTNVPSEAVPCAPKPA